jgi:hypothetical protein
MTIPPPFAIIAPKEAVMIVDMLADHRVVLSAVGFLLILAGAVVPFLMVSHVVQTSFALSFMSYGASVAGLMLLAVRMASAGVRRAR